MKINCIKLYEYSLYLIVFLYLGFINLFKDLNSISISIDFLITICLFVIFLIQKNKHMNNYKYVSFYIISFYIIFIIDLFRLKTFSLSGYTISDALVHDRYYIFLLLVFPISEILFSKRRQKFIINIYYIGVLILIFRFFAWYIYNKLHFNVAPGYFQVMGYEWARMGLTRLSGSFLDNYVWVMALIRILKNISLKEIIKNGVVLFICFGYAAIVYNSRSQEIAYLVVLAIYFLLSTPKIYIKILIVLSSFIIIPIIEKGSLFVNFISTFSVTNSDYGSSTQIRTNTLNIYQSLWLKENIWLGYGISNDGNYFSNSSANMINQSDLGIISSLYQFGIVGFLIMISPFIMAFFISLKYLNHIENKFLFLFSISTLLTSIMSQNMYDPFRSLIIPFLLAFIVYVNVKNKEGKKNE